MTQRALAASCVGLLLAAAASTATAETFVFRDSRRPRIRGRVLVEFRDVLFVALDGQPQRFLARAELAAIIDNDGRRHDDLALGTFGPDGGDSPAAAITDVLGDVQLADSSLRDDRQPAFARAGDTIRTGESGLARLAFPSGASVKLGPESRIELPADGDGLVLRGGELFCEPDLRPLSIRLSETAEIDVAPGAVGTIRRDDEGTHVQQHRGDAQLSWGDSELSLGPGLGARLRPQTDGSYRLDADPTNPEPLRLRSAGEVVVVPAGDAHATTQDSKVEATADPVGSSGVWTLVRVEGSVSVQTSALAAATPAVLNQAEQIEVSDGGTVLVGVTGRATLHRADGAALIVSQGGELRFGAGLQLLTGAVRIEATTGPVRLQGPGGISALQSAVVRLEHTPPPPDAPAAPPLTVVEAIAGTPLLQAGTLMRVALQEGARVALEEQGGGRLRVEVLRGLAALRSHPSGDLPDPRVDIALEQERGVTLVETPETVFPMTLELPRNRCITLPDPGLDAAFTIGPDLTCRFGNGAELTFKKGLQTSIGRSELGPELRFVSGPRLTIAKPFKMHVENPTVIIDGEQGVQTTLALEGNVQATLVEGSENAVAAIRTRTEDVLELGPNATARLDEHKGMMRFALTDGPRLLVQSAAPPVEARFSGTADALFLSMPNTPSLEVATTLPATVLVTNQGEFVLLDGNLAAGRLPDGGELVGLAGSQQQSRTASADLWLDDEGLLGELLNAGPVDSPSGP